MISRRSCRAVTSMSMRPISSASRFWRVRKARFSGAGAEAGVVRYITNKPKLNVTEGTVNAGYATTAHGDPSSNADATLNIPLIEDTLAVRAVVYSDSRGGYINNVPGTFVRQSTDGGIHYANYTNNMPGPATRVNSANNSSDVGNAINPVTYKGIRVGGLLKFNDDWNALLVQSYQQLDAEGVFYETPQSSGVPAVPLPDLSVQDLQPVVRQGPLRKHGVDRQRPAWIIECGV